jgi:hypothetical protein
MASLTALQKALEKAQVDYVVIGAHAVNAWIEPRFTGDFDITVQADHAALERLEQALEEQGYARAGAEGDELASGPDFVRFVSRNQGIDLEVQVAKTKFQSSAIERGARPGELRVATPEDLIIMKLIAYRPKDRADLAGLVKLDDVDWGYVDRWAKEWDVSDRLAEARAAS